MSDLKEATGKVVVVVNPDEGIDFMSYDSIKARLDKLPSTMPGYANILTVFEAHDEEVRAGLKADKSTADYVFDLTAEGIPANEVLDTFITNMKEAGLWPLYLNITTNLYEPRGYEAARKCSLSGKIANRIKAMVGRKDLILDEEGMLQFYEKDGKYVVKGESNTTPDGEFTVGQKRAGEPSVMDVKKAKLASTQHRTVNPAEEKAKKEQEAQQDGEVQTAEQVRKLREKRDLIAQGYANALKGLIATQKVHESHRAELAKVNAGKAYLADMQGLLEKDIDNLYDLAEVLQITEKNGKMIVNL